MPFAYFLFQKRKHPVLPWFVGSLILSFATVVSMSAVTGYVDKTPVMPQSIIEWKEFIEKGAFNTTTLSGKEFADWVAKEEARHIVLMKSAGFISTAK